MATQPQINDGNIPSGSRFITFHRPDGSVADFSLLAEDFSPDPNPIEFTDRKGLQGQFAGGIGRSAKSTGSMTVQNIFLPSGTQTSIALVKTGDLFSQNQDPNDAATVINYVVITAPQPDKNSEDKKQNVTFQGIANPDAYFASVAGVLTLQTLPITQVNPFGP